MRKIATIVLAVFMLITAEAATAAPLESGLATTEVKQLPPPPPAPPRPRLGKVKLPARSRPKARRPGKLRIKLPPPPPAPPRP